MFFFVLLTHDCVVTEKKKQEGHNDPVLLHWLIYKIPSYQTLQYLGIGLKHKTTKTGLKFVAIILMFSNKKILKISLYKPM